MNYIIIGTSYHLINDEINSIIKSKDNLLSFDLDECKMADVIKETNYMSLFEEEKYIIIKNCSCFYRKNNQSEEDSQSVSDKDSDLLYEYLTNPNPMITMIIILEKEMASNKKISKLAVEKCDIRVLPEYKAYDFKDLIKKIFSKDGYKIDEVGVSLIVERTLGDYDLLLNEIDKLKLYFDSKVINNTELDLVLSRAVDDDIFKFVNSFIKKDFKKYMNFYEELKIAKIEPLLLLGALASKYRTLWILKKMNDDKKSFKEMMSVIGQKEYAVKKSLEDSFSYRYEELEDKIKKLAELDNQIKIGDIDKYLGFEMFLLEVD